MPVNTEHAKYQEMKPKWTRCRDVTAGSDAVRAKGEEYLPKPKGQDRNDYNAYKLRATFYNATWRTVAGLVGMIYRKPAKLEVPDGLEELLDDVDGAGTPFEVFSKLVMTDAVRFGRIGVLVDHPESPEGATLATRDKLNLRPTLQMYAPEAIINWREGMVNNRKVLTRAVLFEPIEIEVDEFESKSEDRWRVLDLVDVKVSPGEGEGATTKAYRQRIFRKRDPGDGQARLDEFEQVGEAIFPKMNGQPLTYIPFKILATETNGVEVDDPPLIDLVDMNLSHYRTTAIYEQCLVFCPPTLMLTGIRDQDENGNKQEFHVGTLAAITTNDVTANGFYIEPSGSAWQFLLDSLKEKEQRMAVLGARMLESQKAAPETADSLSLQAKGEEAMLAALAKSGSLALTQTLKWLIEWTGKNSEEVSYELNRDFYPAAMTPAMVTSAIAAWQAGAPGFSDKGLFDLFKKGEIIADEVTLEDEQRLIKERGPVFVPTTDPALQPEPPAPAAPKPALPKSKGKATGLGGKPDRSRARANQRKPVPAKQ